MVLEMKSAADAGLCVTECAHIFPESTNANISASGSNAQGGKVYFFPT